MCDSCPRHLQGCRCRCPHHCYDVDGYYSVEGRERYERWRARQMTSLYVLGSVMIGLLVALTVLLVLAVP